MIGTLKDKLPAWRLNLPNANIKLVHKIYQWYCHKSNNTERNTCYFCRQYYISTNKFSSTVPPKPNMDITIKYFKYVFTVGSELIHWNNMNVSRKLVWCYHIAGSRAFAPVYFLLLCLSSNGYFVKNICSGENNSPPHITEKDDNCKNFMHSHITDSYSRTLARIKPANFNARIE